MCGLGAKVATIAYDVSNVAQCQALTPHQWLDYAKANFDQVYREGEEGNPKMMSLGLHLRIIGRPGRTWALEEFFKHVRSKPDVWVTTRHQIAKHLAKVDPA